MIRVDVHPQRAAHRLRLGHRDSDVARADTRESSCVVANRRTSSDTCRTRQRTAAVVDVGSRHILSWVERQGQKATLRFSERTPNGWSTPRDAASGNDWFVNWADVPSVIRLANGTLVAHWLQKSGPGTYAYDVRLSHSKDDGKTWSPSFTPHTTARRRSTDSRRSFEMPGAGLGLVWLDGRAMKHRLAHGGGHGAADGGAMSVRFAAFDGTWKQTSEVPVDLRVCECCPTTAAVTAEGPIVAYRDRSDRRGAGYLRVAAREGQMD